MCSVFFFFKQKTAYEMRISDWSSDVCSSDLALDQQRLGGMVKSAIADRLRELDVPPRLGQALHPALAEGRHQPLLDAMVKCGSKTLELNDHLIHQMVHENSNAIVRFTGLADSISNHNHARLSKLISEMAVEEHHPLPS